MLWAPPPLRRNEASTEIWDQVDQLAQHYQSVATFVRMNMCTETEPLMKSWDVDELPTFVFLKGCRPAHKNLGVLAGEFDPHVLETTVRKLVNAPGASTSTHEISWVFPAENIEFSVYQSTAVRELPRTPPPTAPLRAPPPGLAKWYGIRRVRFRRPAPHKATRRLQAARCTRRAWGEGGRAGGRTGGRAGGLAGW